MKRTHKNRQEGVVLIAVIWSVFILAAMAFALSALVRSGTEELRARKEHLQAVYVARGAVNGVTAIIMAATSPQNAGAFRPGQSKLEWDDEDAHVVVNVEDEGGKIDVNSAPAAMQEQLFVNLGMDAQAAHELVAAIADWRDADDETRIDGAESLYYLALPQPYRPANRDLQKISELLLVRGVTPELFYGGYEVKQDGTVIRKPGLVDCMTVNSHAQAVNINYAPLPVLLAVPGMTPDIANMIVEGRQQQPYRSVSDFTHEYPILLGGNTLSYLSTGSTGTYSLIASATTPGGIAARVRAVVQLGGAVQQGKPFSILEWNDFYVQ